MGFRTDYNCLEITIPLDVIHASQIGISGITLGSAKDFEAIKAQCPMPAKVTDPNSLTSLGLNQDTGVARKTSNANIVTIDLDSAAAYAHLKKSGSVMKYVFENY